MSTDNNISNSPGVFSGGCKLASVNDLQTLRNEILNLLTGPNENLGANGYIPWKLTNDGSLDIEALFPELVAKYNQEYGLDISNDGVKVIDGVKAINFTGKYVSLKPDDDGNLILNIDEPNEAISRFNQASLLSNALVNITTEIIDEVIIPDTTQSSEYRNRIGEDWLAGEKRKAVVKKHNDHDYFEFNTNGPVFTSSKSSFFEVRVYDANNNERAAFISRSIDKNTVGTSKLDAAGTINSEYIYIYISDFKEETNGYSFKPRFKIDLLKILSDGGRFRIEVNHRDSANTYKFVSDEMLYVVGERPEIKDITIGVVTDESQEGRAECIWSSGIKYMKAGNIVVTFPVTNMNKMAAVENNFDYEFGNVNDGASLSGVGNTLKIDADTNWKITLPIKKNIIANEIISGHITAKNAYTESDTKSVNLKLLINSMTTMEESTDLKECFSNEIYRRFSDVTQTEVWNSEVNILEDYDNLNLMVIPGKGLVYPYGEWATYTPAGSPNYNDNSYLTNEKYFVRKFTGNNSIKFGGIFVIDGLTKEDFFDARFSFVFTNDNALNWYSLKDIRNSEVSIERNSPSFISAHGVMTDIQMNGDKLYVTWSYPKNICSSAPIFIKLGMKPTSPYCIKSIQLLNLDGSEDW